MNCDLTDNLDLFATDTENIDNQRINLAEQSCLLKGFALPFEQILISHLHTLLQQAPLRIMQTPGGKSMSVAMSNCGQLGWISDHSGYRYSSKDPVSQSPWPAMPAEFIELAQTAACAAGFPDFQPQACLINCYHPGTRMGLHQDKDEQDLEAPIISVSLGIPAQFLFAGLRRDDKAQQLQLNHGDVMVWGGKDRLRYHGVKPIAQASHPLFGEQRFNLTFRRVTSQVHE